MNEIAYYDFENKKDYNQLKDYVKTKVEYLNSLNLEYSVIKKIVFDDNFNNSILNVEVMKAIKVYFKRLIIYQNIKRA